MIKILENGLNIICGECKGIILDNDSQVTEELENINYYIEFEDGSKEWLLRGDFEIIEKIVGYGIFDFDNTGMLEIQKIDKVNIFKSDDEAVEQAIKDGIKVIPVEELPQNFDRKYLGWIDTVKNREAIKKYCK